MKIRAVTGEEKNCCANCKKMFVDKVGGKAHIVCRADGHSITYCYKKICDEWEKF